jgi:Fe-S-cluster containining protein
MAEYRRFRQRLDATLALAWQEVGRHMQCRAGCFACCHNDFRVSPVEAEGVRTAVLALSESTQAQIQAQCLEPGRTLCPLLVAGQCAIYSDRPILCRIFGFPVSDGTTTATCELNFTDLEAEALLALPAFSTEALSGTLQAISRLYLRECGQTPLPEDVPPPMMTLTEALAGMAPSAVKQC